MESLFHRKKSGNKFPSSFRGLTSMLRRPATSHEHLGHETVTSITGTDLLEETPQLSKLKLCFNHVINSV